MAVCMLNIVRLSNEVGACVRLFLYCFSTYVVTEVEYFTEKCDRRIEWPFAWRRASKIVDILPIVHRI